MKQRLDFTWTYIFMSFVYGPKYMVNARFNHVSKSSQLHFLVSY